MQMSPVEHYSTLTPEIPPTSWSTRGPVVGLPRVGSMPRKVVMIQREYTSDFDIQIPSTAFLKPSYEEKNLYGDPCDTKDAVDYHPHVIR